MSPFVSTGELPPRADVRRLVTAAHAAAAGVTGGTTSSVYPALERVDPHLFGVSVVSAVSGERYDAGDVTVEFVLMSVSKPFVFALLCADVGPQAARDLVGVDPTGRPFNSVEAIVESPDGRTNPMVNPGAIATTSHVRGGDAEERWARIRDRLGAFAGRDLALDDEVYASATTNLRNRALASALAERGRLGCDPVEALDLYTRQCCLRVTAQDLAVMGATLADGGRNPVTGVQVIDPALCQPVLAVMTTAGMYQDSGRWLYDVGLPAKSGIGGGIVTVAPGKAGMGTFSPPLDAAGNSVRGVHVAASLSQQLGLALFASSPH